MSDKIQDEKNSLERNCNLDMQFTFKESIKSINILYNKPNDNAQLFIITKKYCF